VIGREVAPGIERVQEAKTFLGPYACATATARCS
jgi:hypothetical protein